MANIDWRCLAMVVGYADLVLNFIGLLFAILGLLVFAGMISEIKGLFVLKGLTKKMINHFLMIMAIALFMVILAIVCDVLLILSTQPNQIASNRQRCLYFALVWLVWVFAFFIFNCVGSGSLPGGYIFISLQVIAYIIVACWAWQLHKSAQPIVPGGQVVYAVPLPPQRDDQGWNNYAPQEQEHDDHERHETDYATGDEEEQAKPKKKKSKHHKKKPKA